MLHNNAPRSPVPLRGSEIPGASRLRDRSNAIYPFRTVGMKSKSHVIGDMISRAGPVLAVLIVEPKDLIVRRLSEVGHEKVYERRLAVTRWAADERMHDVVGMWVERKVVGTRGFDPGCGTYRRRTHSARQRVAAAPRRRCRKKIADVERVERVLADVVVTVAG